MEFHDSETQRLLRMTARSFFADAFPFERLSALHTGKERLSSVDIGALEELGWLSLVSAEEAGGGSLLEAAVLVEETGYACAPAPIAIANVAASLMSHPPLSTELATPPLTTISSCVPARLLISDGAVGGTLRAVPFADVSSSVIAMIALEGSEVLATLPLKGASVEPLVLLDRACYANVTFLGTPANDVQVIAEGQDVEALQSLASALLTAFTTLEMAGLMQRVLEMTSEYVKTRQQFGQPIGKFQAARHRAAELLTQVETTRWAAYHALWQYEQDGDPSEIWLAKHWAARAADRVFQIAHLLHGGVGVDVEHPLHLYTQSIAAFAVRSGTLDEMTDRTLQSLQIPA